MSEPCVKRFGYVDGSQWTFVIQSAKEDGQDVWLCKSPTAAFRLASSASLIDCLVTEEARRFTSKCDYYLLATQVVPGLNSIKQSTLGLSVIIYQRYYSDHESFLLGQPIYRLCLIQQTPTSNNTQYGGRRDDRCPTKNEGQQGWRQWRRCEAAVRGEEGSYTKG